MTKAVRLTDRANEDLNLLAESLGQTKMVTIELALKYISKNKIDLNSNGLEDPGKEFKKLRDTVVSFIREQEKRYLHPTKEMLSRVEQIMNVYKPEGKEQLNYSKFFETVKPSTIDYLSKMKARSTMSDQAKKEWASTLFKNLSEFFTTELKKYANSKV